VILQHGVERFELHERMTSIDFCQLFRREMKGLYLLAFLLTGHQKTAEECFATSLADCVRGIAVDRESAHSWAKRVVIKNAIRLVTHHFECASREAPWVSSGIDEETSKHCTGNLALRSVLALGHFERLVFVMSVLEGLSERESAVLLECLPKQIREALVRALRQVAASHIGRYFGGARGEQEAVKIGADDSSSQSRQHVYCCTTIQLKGSQQS
jgi:DNA-directed RNA polymerase specialized sigma24 family protein